MWPWWREAIAEGNYVVARRWGRDKLSHPDREVRAVDENYDPCLVPAWRDALP